MEEKRKRDEYYPIQIRLKGGAGTYHFQPGDTLSGSVEIHPDMKIACRGVELRIGWYSEGKGTRNDGHILHKRYGISEISSAEPFYEQFDIDLPRSPWSHAGHYINIVWAVQVKIDIPMAADYNHEQRFILQP